LQKGGETDKLNNKVERRPKKEADRGSSCTIPRKGGQLM